ncbi:MAG TPA: hypothetical protein DC000_03290 [Clostridiales bacterium]|nr:hypothetical protein [Clostridiales bacterium]
MGWLIASIICAIEIFVGISVAIAEKDVSMLSISIIFLFGSIFFYKKYKMKKCGANLIKKNTKKEHKESVRQEKDKLKEYNKTHYKVKHILGLPLSENTECVISKDKEKIEIIAGGNTFNLNLDKVTDIKVLTSEEIQKQYVSSVGGAVGGAVLLGPLGAMIGGRAKEKKTTTITQYLSLTYLKDNEIAFMSFELSPYGLSPFLIWQKEFIPKEKPIINL